MGRKKLRQLRCLVTAQTAANLERLAQMGGCESIGRAVDKLVREKMVALYFYREARKCGERAERAMKQLEKDLGREFKTYDETE